MTKFFPSLCVLVLLVSNCTAQHEFRLSVGHALSSSIDLAPSLTYSERELYQSGSIFALEDVFRTVNSTAQSKWASGNEFSASIERHVSNATSVFAEFSYTSRTLELEQEIVVDFQYAEGEDAELFNGYSLYNDVLFKVASVGGKMGVSHRLPFGLVLSCSAGGVSLVGDSISYSNSYALVYENGDYLVDKISGNVDEDFDALDAGTATIRRTMFSIQPRVAYEHSGVELFVSMTQLNPGEGLYMPLYDRTMGFTRPGFDLSKMRSIIVGLAYRYRIGQSSD